MIQAKVLFRENLLQEHNLIGIEDIDVAIHFMETALTAKQHEELDIIMFVDNDARSATRILKNRYGKIGMIC
jgi:hypothetical protein